jgi:hypothetical protein
MSRNYENVNEVVERKAEKAISRELPPFSRNFARASALFKKFRQSLRPLENFARAYAL